MERDKRIAIIGAGISGLMACKYALEKGFSPIVFEARSDIGGVWSQTIESTKLQTPKDFYQFSDFSWPPAVQATFPDHTQVLEYVQDYAVRFNILPRIKFNSKVTCIDYVTSSAADLLSWDLWGDSGEPFSPSGKWHLTVRNAKNPSSAAIDQVYQVDFVILCIGRYSDLPNIPDFPLSKGPEVLNGKVLHSMDYAAMDDDVAAELIKGKRVTVVGFQKSAVDIAAEVASKNGASHPCTLLFKTAHWTVPEYLLPFVFRGLNRFTELMVHKPGEGFFMWLLALFCSPLLWIFSTSIECYLKCVYPLKKYNMVPAHKFLKQISSCKFTVLPANFYDRVKDGSLFLKKSQSFSFCKNGLIVQGESRPLQSDIVIFATGYKSEEKLKNIFRSNFFHKCISGSSAPFYRECIHPRIPQLAILGYADSPAILYSTEMRSKWLAHFLAGNFRLPTISKMEEDVLEWEKCKRSDAEEGHRSCVSTLLQIYCNDQLCKDMRCNPRRKSGLLAELFEAYCPNDYKAVS
ncbi:flavin-dependent monooxygenase 1 [Hibiscus trionum]|uniref:Flavin-containing monooxygenase n=1 Tax=Hibiscus trionum TaxID=183268 RepID=A0A9W7MXL5_HIBTR|nr:flavin-dependent monooxygenase 1 [Hibiscus trionum]